MKKNSVLLGVFSVVCVFLFVWYMHLQKEEPKLNTSAKSSAGDEDDPQARLRHEWMMLRDPATGQIPKDIRKKELEFAQSLPTREQVNALNKTANAYAANWVSRGPWNVGGRTRALGIDVSNANVVIAGGVSGGMWRSADGGTTWTKTSAPGSLHSVSCLAQDTRAGQTATWYYGTGEFLGGSASGGGASFSGDGIFKSTNNGTSWTLLPATSTGLPQTFDNFFDYVWNIAVDPTNGNVFAATYGAIFRSTNGGTNWTVVLGGASPYSSISDIQVASNGTLYATGSADGGIAGVWKSTTGALGTWTNITPGDMTNTVRRIVIGIAPSNSNTVYVVAETPSAGTNGHSFWKYNATGNTCQNRSANIPAYGGLTGNFDSQGSYDLVIKVKPDDENIVIIGGTNLFRSTDGFSTTGATTWIGGYTSENNSYALYPNHHPDNHSLAFAPNNASVFFSGHDGGISKTTNVLASPLVWQQLSSGYLTTQFYTVAMDHGTNGSSIIIGGLQDNGCWKTISSSGTATWTSLFGGDGAYTAIANGGGSEYVSAQNGLAYRFFGAEFARVDPTGGAGYLFINPFVLDPNNSNIMYFAGGNYAWRNSDLTAIPAGSNNTTSVNWTRLNNSAIAGQTQVSALAVSKANPANRLYIARSPQGYLTRVDNANTGDPAGVDIGAAIPTGFISSVAVDPTDGNKVFVVFSNYNLASLWYSSDAGATWADVEGNLAGANGPSCRSVTIVPIGGSTYYVLGTSTGAYSTTTLNGASTVWAQEGANTIGNVVVTFLDSRPSDRTVIAATHANGVFSADIVSGVEDGGGIPSEFALDQNYPNPFNPSTTIRFAVPAQISNARLTIYDLSGRNVWSKTFADLPPGTHETVWDGNTTAGAKVASGMYLYQLSAGGFSASKRMLLIK